MAASGAAPAPAERLACRQKARHSRGFEYAPGRIRTCDFCLRRAALYPLSYGREVMRV